MLDLKTIPRLRDDVRFRIIGDEALIVCQDSGEILAVNTTGRIILQAIDGHKSTREIIDALGSVYDLPVEQLERDFFEFLSDMRDAGVFES